MSRISATRPSSPRTDTPNLKDATLGIDFGSTSTRATLWCLEENKEYYIQCPKRDEVTVRFEASDFSSIGYPFDDGEVYIGQKIDPSRVSTSLKYGFYVLADASAQLATQYRLSEPLRRRQAEDGFRDRLEEGIRKLFTEIYHCVRNICTRRSLNVTTIGLSTPSQWTLDFIGLYRGIIADVFEHNLNHIFCVTEVEALTHFLCTSEMDQLIPPSINDTVVNDTTVVVLDFGGHTMNTCTIKIVREADKYRAFYLVGEPKGAPGGSELWEYLLVGESLYVLRIAYGIRPSATNKQKLLDSINIEKRRLGPNYKNKCFLHSVIEDGVVHKIILAEPCVVECFDQALKEPLVLANSQVKEAIAGLQHESQTHTLDSMHKPRVILSGGTARHEGLVSRVKEICRQNDLADPMTTDDMSIQYDSAKIATGAAYAAASSITVEEFIRRGAAFGIQVRQALKPGIAVCDHKWDNTAKFLWSQDWPGDYRTHRGKLIKSLRVDVHEGDELKIICDPFYAGDANATKELYFDRCYDFIHLGSPPEGRWYFRPAMLGEGNQMKLKIERSSRKLDGSKETTTPDISVTLPLHYNRGSNTIHPGEEFSDPAQDENILSLRHYQRSDDEGSVVPERPRFTARRGRNPRMPQLGARHEVAARRGAAQRQ